MSGSAHTAHALFPCPAKQQTMSQPVKAWNLGSAWAFSGPRAGAVAEFARNWIYKERGWKLQGKEYSRKAPKIRIRVNLQGMELSRKSRSGIRKEQYLQGNEFATNGTRKERGWNLQGMDFARNADYAVSITVPYRRQYLACYSCICHMRVWVVKSSQVVVWVWVMLVSGYF